MRAVRLLRWSFLFILLAGTVVGAAPLSAQPPVALGGLDPVTVSRGGPQPGRAELFRDKGPFRYLFASEDNRKEFDDSPDYYGLQRDGSCAMMPGTPTDGQIFAVYNERLFAFGSESCKAQFLADPARYVAALRGQKSVAILVFEGVQIIDYTGPYEVFGQAGYRVYTVAPKAGTVTTAMGMKITPDYTLDQAPEAEVIVVPGGGVRSVQDVPEVHAWLKQRGEKAKHVLSVCNGAFILGAAGMLDGLTATTFYGLIPDLKETFSKVRVVSDQRYVDNGKIITTAGLSSGIDGSLHVVERLQGRGTAQRVALNLEYDWKPDSSYARASFADLPLRQLFGNQLRLQVPQGGKAELLSTQGDRNRWEARWRLETPAPLAELRTALVDHLTQNGGWTPGSTATDWTFADADKKPWKARVELAPEEGAAGTYRMAIRLERAGG